MTPQQRSASRREAMRPYAGFSYPFKYEKQLAGRISLIYKKYAVRLLKFVKQRYPRKFAYDSRTDDFATEFEIFLREIQDEYTAEAISGTLQFEFTDVVRRISNFVKRYNEEEVAAYMKELTGVPFYGSAEWWAGIQKIWIGDAVTRVAGTIAVYYDDVRAMILDAIHNEESYESIVARIMKMDAGISEAKANFLARDLTGKLNGTIERQLQTDLGMGEYFWQTAADERVRGKPGGKYPNAMPSHWAMDSVICSWANPAICSFDYGKTWVPRPAIAPTLHPGMDWQCRCRGTPFSLELLKTLDAELERERQNGTI